MNRYRPELHVTAELGVLEAPAGALALDGLVHVFHQFRPKPTQGARWAHQVASRIPFDWDICDDVIAPEDGEVDVLAGSTVVPEPGEDAAEFFFVTTAPADAATAADVAGNRVPHSHRGRRTFTLQRARVESLSSLCENVSDDATQVDEHVRRLGPIDVDDSAYPVEALVTPSVIHHEDGWRMVALSLRGDTDAEAVILGSSDRQHWTVLGPLELPEEAGVRPGRPYAPRIVKLDDAATGVRHDVLLITYPGVEGESEEVAGYLVGHLRGTGFEVTTPYTVIDHGHDFTRPRLVQGPEPMIIGLVGAHPATGSVWANCLSSPRYLSLVNGHIFQDIAGVPKAVTSFSDRAAVWTGQLEAGPGVVTVSLVDAEGSVYAEVRHDGDHVTVSRGGDKRTVTLIDSDSDTLTVFVDGPVLEVFADGGAATLTSALQTGSPFDHFDVTVTGDATVTSSLVSLGQKLQRQTAGLDSPEEQERLIRESALAYGDLEAMSDRDDADAVAAGTDSD